MFCLQCGREVENGVVYCPNCGAQLTHNQTPVREKSTVQSILSIIFGGLGIILAWVFALFGYALGGVGLGLGLAAIRKNDKTKGIIGIVLSSITLLFSVINSVMGVLIVLGLTL